MSRRVAIASSELLGVPGTGGPGTADSLLAVALARHGHDVELLLAPGREIEPLSPEWRRAYDSSGVRVRHLADQPGVRPQFLAPASAILEGLRADPPDVVVADDWRGLAYLALRSRQLGRAFADTAFVVYCHGPARWLAQSAHKVPDTLARFGEEVGERVCLELADAVVCPSEWLLRWMRDHGWPVPETARVIQNLWQSTALDEPPAQAPAGSAVRRLAFFGQLREGKGILVFVKSLRNLEANLLQGVELLFLGRETPRWTEERIREALGPHVPEQVASIRFETGLERSAALEELRQPGTLAVIPSLADNSPYAVAECIEHGIPFVATRTGGIPELVANEDRARVLCPPTAEDLATALTAALASRAGFAPAHAASPPKASLEAWLELVEAVVPSRPRAVASAARVTVVAGGEDSTRRAGRLAQHTRSVEVDVVSAESRRAGLDVAKAADWVLFLDDDDLPDDQLLDALVAAQAASGADVVTAAVRPADDLDGLQLFVGEPGALGLVENQYGVLGLVRRSLVPADRSIDGPVDPDWLLLARLALAGARVVSIPEPLSVHRGRPGTVADVPGVGLDVLEAFEERGDAPLDDLPQLAATLAAALARLQSGRPGSNAAGRGVVRRGVALLRSEGLAGLVRRAGARVGGH
jgi:glycosyltransferase involved in cell wall biosynthesis